MYNKTKLIIYAALINKIRLMCTLHIGPGQGLSELDVNSLSELQVMAKVSD